jgi:hypothetical protein
LTQNRKRNAIDLNIYCISFPVPDHPDPDDQRKETLRLAGVRVLSGDIRLLISFSSV